MSTIFALSSGILPSAIALFRLSGVRSLPVLREITRKEKWEPRRLNYVKIYSLDGDILDKAMAVYMPGPSTFTGEDTAELFVHGSRAVADALGSRLAGIEGVRQAIRGEFTKRAFYNNKMDLSEVHGLRSLINAETQRQRQMSFVQMQGGSIARRIRDQLADVVMRSFILMDFGEHVDSTIDEVKSLVSSILSEVNLLENRARGFEIVQRGLRAVLVGRPNTGKSSLLNALARRDVAIVSEQAGTTRDSIEVRLDIGGVPVTLTDTAGMRNTVDLVEIKGIERTKQKITDADLVLIVVNATDNANEFEEILRELQDLCQKSQPIIMIKNKCDLLPTVSTQDLSKLELSNITDCVSTCALSHEGVSPLVFSLQKFIENLCPSDIGPWLSDRQLLSASEGCRKICIAFEEDEVKERTARKWFQKFPLGVESLQDAPRTGRPLSLNYEDLRIAIETNSKLICVELSNILNENEETIISHLHQLGKRWKLSEWVLHSLTTENK